MPTSTLLPNSYSDTAATCSTRVGTDTQTKFVDLVLEHLSSGEFAYLRI
jgi:hypothetical protein